MAIHRFYCDRLDEGVVELDEQQSTHARKTLRLEPGADVTLMDGLGAVAQGTIVRAAQRVRVKVADLRRTPRPEPWIDLATAIPKGGRADVLIEQASQLGADRLIPLSTERGVVQPRKGKLGRFRRVAIESIKQCARPWAMQIAEPVPLKRLLSEWGDGLKLMADAGGDAAEDAIQTPGADRALLLIGPEGGWTDAERRLGKEAGCMMWKLGPHVMRLETAAAAALAMLRGRG